MFFRFGQSMVCEIFRPLTKRVGVPVIASGGAGTLEHLYEGVTAGGAEAALVASLVHYNIHTIREMKDYLAERGVSVRRIGANS